MIILFFLISFLLIPEITFAWGPLTHIYLGSEIYSYASLIPASVMTLLRRYRQDFIYGNLMADIILGKKYLPEDKSSHSWDVGLNLLKQAKKGSEKAFVYGYLSHLAADTVAHEALTEDKWDIGHAWIEIKADSLIKKTYWLESVTINKAVQMRNDKFLEGSLDRFVFSFKTNKRIYKGMVFLSLFNKKRTRGIDKGLIKTLHDESIASILDLLQKGKDSFVIHKNPI